MCRNTTPQLDSQEPFADDLKAVATGVLEAVTIPAVILDDTHCVIAVNPPLCRHLGLTADEVIGRSVDSLSGGALKIPELMERLHEIVPDRDAFQEFEVEHEFAEGGPRQLYIHARQIILEKWNRRLILLTIADVPQARLHDPPDAEHDGRVRVLTAELAMSDERLRRNLAMRLHDGLIQTLVLAKRELSLLQDRLGEHGGATQMQRCESSLDEAISESRGIMYELSPPMLYDLGLVPALKWLADHFSERFELRVEVIAGSSIPALDRSTEIIVFRAVRELLLNAGKYAGEGEVIVTVGSEDAAAQFTVRDYGPGFDVSKLGVRADGTLGFGLLSIREQITEIGGQMDVHSIIGEGTRVTLTVPAAGNRVHTGE